MTQHTGGEADNQDLGKGAVAFGNKPALIVVDMSNGFTQFDSPLGGASESVVTANQKLLSTFRLSALPVCFTSVVYRDDHTNAVFRAHLPDLNILKPDTHWVNIDERLARLSNEPVFEKTGPSAFFGTELEAWLVLNDVDALVVTGLTTSGCVRATVVDGLQYDYPLWVADDACGDRNQDAHQANLHDMNAKYAEVKSTNAIIKHIAPTGPVSESDYI